MKYAVVPLSKSLDAWDDVDSLTAESRTHLERAHEAHVVNDWPKYLRSVAYINDRLIRIHWIAADEKARLADAPTVHPDQIAIWTCRDKAVVAATGVAA